MRATTTLLALLAIALPSACSSGSSSSSPSGTQGSAADPSASGQTGSSPAGSGGGGSGLLLVATSEFPVVDGRPSSTPGPAKLIVMTRRDGRWATLGSIDDRESNVFHKAMPFTPPGGQPGILTIGGNAAALKLWRRQGGQWRATTLWQTTFGGTQNRLRDVEAADVDGDGQQELVVATHDQGVVAIVDWTNGQPHAQEIDRHPDTFVHEIEIGDVDGDGHPEIYATPSEPNRLEGGTQHGIVARYVRRGDRWVREVAADLGNRHAKEILVTDMDADGTPELYVAVEALTTGQGGATIVEGVEIRRFVRGSAPGARDVVARLDDRFMRFLMAGDVDGDGRQEMVAASFSTGLWLLRPTASGEWRKSSIEATSGGWEHASALLDLDGDGRLELYAADDNHGALRCYTWANGSWRRELVAQRAVPRSRITWYVGSAPAALAD